MGSQDSHRLAPAPLKARRAVPHMTHVHELSGIVPEIYTRQVAAMKLERRKIFLRYAPSQDRFPSKVQDGAADVW